MDREKESPPERLPFCLDDTVGEIVRACQECPGVYYIAARKQDGSLALFELWGQYEELRTGGLINYPALMNYIWAYFPEYAATYNMQNQMGMHDTFGLLMNALGAEVELQNNPNEVLSLIHI